MEIIDQPTETQWREALADPAATFFHTPEWSRLMEEAFPASVESRPAAFRFSDGAVVVLPLMRLLKLRGLARSLHSMFPGVYGGPVCARALTGEERLAINEWLAGREGMRTFCLAPPGVSNPVPSGARPLSMTTQRLTLEKDLDLRSSGLLSHGKKYSLRRAEREGVRVRSAESPDDWMDYFRAYRASMERWQDASAYRYPRRLFERMAGDTSGGISLRMAVAGGEFAAGAIVLSHGNHVVTWHEASFQRFHKLRVKDYLLIRIIEDAAREGYPSFDFNPSGGHETVEEFKASFGAEKVSLEAWIREPAWVRGGKRLRSVFRKR
jgi:CelD/BcsL family acetyltransferase involved in cellulose biosynthesis